MLSANEAKEITNSNRYKVDSTRGLMLNYILRRIEEEANKGLSTIDLETGKTSDITYSDYCHCVYNLRRAGYRVKHFKSMIHISW
jgi:hypothetical protein